MYLCAYYDTKLFDYIYKTKNKFVRKMKFLIGPIQKKGKRKMKNEMFNWCACPVTTKSGMGFNLFQELHVSWPIFCE